MDLWDSPIKITRDPEGTPEVVLDYGDPLAELPRIDGRQIVEVLTYVRAASATTIARGNESHSLQWTVATPETSIDAAVATAFNHAKQVARETALYQIETATGGNWLIYSATMQSWSGAIDDALSRITFALVGGALAMVVAYLGGGLTYYGELLTYSPAT